MPGWGEYFPRFIYLDLRLNVIPPIPALARFPRYGNAHQEKEDVFYFFRSEERGVGSLIKQLLN